MTGLLVEVCGAGVGLEVVGAPAGIRLWEVFAVAEPATNRWLDPGWPVGAAGRPATGA